MTKEYNPDVQALLDEADIKPERKPNLFTEVTILELYGWLWKLFIASLLFSIPFLLLLAALNRR